jgi:hypothetical protein
MTLPVSIEYSVDTTTSDTPCVIIKKQSIDWEGRSVGTATESVVTIPEIEQLVGFCLRCGNSELLRAVRRPVYRMSHGPDHPFAKQ